MMIDHLTDGPDREDGAPAAPERSVEAAPATTATSQRATGSTGTLGGRWGDRRWPATLVVVALALLVPTIGLGMLLDHGGSFCRDVDELPALSSSLGEDGTPGPALVHYATALDAVAASAPDAATADAARGLAAHDRALGAALSGSSSSSSVVADVSSADSSGAPAVDAARRTLGDAIRRECG